MSLKELVGAGDRTLFPGFILAPPRLAEFAEAEELAAKSYLDRLGRAAAALPEPLQHLMFTRAVDALKGNPFAYGSADFDRWALSMSALPQLLWLLLRINAPKLELPTVKDLLNDPNQPPAEYNRRVDAIWRLWGYQVQVKKKPDPKSAPPSTGTTSSPPSEKPDLTTSKSPA